MSTAADLPTERQIGLVIDHDPAVWLPGPVHRTREEWLAAAESACAVDFGVVEGSDEASYLREVLTEFVEADLKCDFRFLRMRALVDLPLTARISVARGTQAGQLPDPLASFDPDQEYYAEPQVEEVDRARGLRRAIIWQTEDGLRSVIRYHRRVSEWESDLVVSCSGADLRGTALGLSDLDELARAIWFVDADGTRR